MVGESEHVLVSRGELPAKTAHMRPLSAIRKDTRLGDPPRIGVCTPICFQHLQVPILPPTSLCIRQVSHPLSVKDRTYKVLRNVATEISPTYEVQVLPNILPPTPSSTPLLVSTMLLVLCYKSCIRTLRDEVNLPDEFLYSGALV
ncbi:hypothetical protein TIFTF001_025327 [Ficus carica]|uniref:Uncharacterized protein n=1 Tax=Ficus carica TaxID=3494 RepID=A0AA88AYR3_FICCA|nr:hypothetical protein TIFTF001_025327 [Ficus carica]